MEEVSTPSNRDALKENTVKLLERRRTGERWMDKTDLASREKSLKSRNYCFLQVFVVQERVTVKRNDRMVNQGGR